MHKTHYNHQLKINITAERSYKSKIINFFWKAWLWMGGLGYWGNLPVWIEVCYVFLKKTGFNWFIHWLIYFLIIYFSYVPGFSNFVFRVSVFRRSDVPEFRRSGVPAFRVSVQAVFKEYLNSFHTFTFKISRWNECHQIKLSIAIADT